MSYPHPPYLGVDRNARKKADAYPAGPLKNFNIKHGVSRRGKIAEAAGALVLTGVLAMGIAHLANKDSDKAPVVDLKGTHKVYSLKEGETLWGAVKEAYPLPENYDSLSATEKMKAEEAVNDRRAEVRAFNAELLKDAGINPGEVAVGQDLEYPPDAATGQLIEPVTTE